MPTLNRPNAPNRLPSADFGGLFNKPRALRASDVPSLSTPSPLTSPSNVGTQRKAYRSSDSSSHSTSSVVSPTSVVPQRRPKPASRWSEASHQSDVSARSAASPGAKATSSALGCITPRIIREEPSALERRVSSNSSRSTNSSSRSITKSKGRKFINIPFLRGAQIEIRIGRKQPSGAQSRSEPEAGIPRQLGQATMTARPPGTEPYLNTAAAVEHQQLLSNIPSSSEGHGTALTPKEGLYCRTKRVLGLKGDPSTTPHPQLQQKTSTGEILDRVASTLRHAPYRHQTTISSITSVSNLSIADPRQQRLRPSHSTCEHSSSSSIRRFMMGKSPAPTPEPEAMYIGSDSNQYMAVEMTEPNNPNFLPSEARRISTPPLPSDTPNKQGMRGFFFDPKAPAAETAQAIKPEGNSRELHERPAHVAEKVWYRVKLEVIDAEVASRAQFVTSAPDHLPNSPLCPRHPKHKSGGTGVCIYHGKNTTFYQDSDTPTPKEDSSNAFGDDIWRIPST